MRERSGSDDDARAEAQSSLQLAPNGAAYLVLARLDLQANQLSECANDVPTRCGWSRTIPTRWA